MANNSVDLVIGSEAIKQVESLISKLSIADAELLKISQSAMIASKGISGISTPSGLDKAVSGTTSLNAQLEKQNAIINKLHADIAKKAEQSRLAEIRLQQQREKAFDSFEKNAQKEQAIATKNASAYNKTQTQINNLTKAYNDLAVRKERYNNLTVNEEMRLKTLSAVNEKYNGILKMTDATIGKNQRNVGNYASGFNSLGNSISQLSREMPAFANSAQTGFMAISNNIPAFQDAIMQLRAGGMSWGGVIKEIGKSMFGLTGMISLATTLLVVLGPKIWDWIKGTDAAEAATNRLTGALKAQNEQLAENLKAIKYQEQIDVSLAKRAGESAEKISEITGKSSRDQVDAAKKVTESIDSQIFAIKSYLALGGIREKFEFLMRRNGEDKAKADKELFRREVTYTKENLDLLIKSRKKAYQEEKNLRDASVLEQTETTTNIILGNEKIDKSEEDRLKAIAERRKKELELELALINQKVNNEDLYFTDRLTALDADFLKRVEIAKIDYDEEFRMSKGNQDRQKTALIDFQLEKLSLIEDYNKKKNTLEQLDLDPITTLAISKNQAKDPFKSVTDSAKNAVKSLRTPAEQLKTDWKDTFNSIADSAQQAGDIIAEFSQRNFDNEYRRLEAQKDIALKFAGDSASARQKIEEDYEKKQKEIANRENKAKQKQAIFNIAIDTAQAIMATVGKTGFAGLPLALILGALGAAQIAMVASQKIPQYFDGTDNHIGGMMLVNDGAGSNYQEKVILPNGKEIMPEGRNVLMNAPKGTKVLTHEQQIMEMLNERGISMSKSYQSNGMTANEMDAVMSKHFAKIQTNHTSFDKKGFGGWLSSNGNKTIQNNNRVSRTGFNV